MRKVVGKFRLRGMRPEASRDGPVLRVDLRVKGGCGSFLYREFNNRDRQDKHICSPLHVYSPSVCSLLHAIFTVRRGLRCVRLSRAVGHPRKCSFGAALVLLPALQLMLATRRAPARQTPLQPSVRFQPSGPQARHSAPTRSSSASPAGM